MVVRIDATTQNNQRINGIGPYLREMSPEFLWFTACLAATSV